MDRLVRIVGVVLLAWLAFAVIGILVGFLVKTVLFVALVAGVVYLVVAASGRNRLTGRRPRSLRNFR